MMPKPAIRFHHFLCLEQRAQENLTLVRLTNGWCVSEPCCSHPQPVKRSLVRVSRFDALDWLQFRAPTCFGDAHRSRSAINHRSVDGGDRSWVAHTWRSGLASSRSLLFCQRQFRGCFCCTDSAESPAVLWTTTILRMSSGHIHLKLQHLGRRCFETEASSSHLYRITRW